MTRKSPGAASATERMGRRAKLVVGPIIVIVMLLSATTGSAEVGAAPAPTKYYMALGASLVTGTGSTGGADYVNDLLAYAQPLIPGLQVENLGCGGETTDTMLHGGHCTKYTTGSQLGDAEVFLRDHPGQVSFVTIDIGADDVLGCAPSGVINEVCFQTGLTKVEADLPQIVSGLRAAGRTVPIVGMTYYDPYLASWFNGTSGQQEAKQSIPLLKQLNSVLTSDYASDGVAIASAFKQFSTTDFRNTGTWDGQTVPDNVATICEWTWMCTPGGPTIHANNTGYTQLADAFEKALAVPPTISGAPPDGTVGQPYSFAFAVSGVPAVKVRHQGTLPKGLQLSRQGMLTGVPARAGTYAFTVTATSRRAGVATVTESVTVAT